MKTHQALFKAQPKYFEDAELRTSLCKMVSRELSSVRGNLKSTLIDSLQHSKNIIDTMQSLAGTKSGMEIGSGHWMRFAFLVSCSSSFLSWCAHPSPMQRRQLRIFTIGMAKDTDTIKEYFSVYLLPSMESDLRTHIADQLGRSLDDLGNELQLKMQDMVPIDLTPASTAGTEGGAGTPHSSPDGTNSVDWDQDAEALYDDECEREQEAHVSNRGDGAENNDCFFKKNGKPRYSEREFWTYADDSLKKLHNQATKKTTNHKVAEKLLVQ